MTLGACWPAEARRRKEASMWCSTCQSVVPAHDERAGEARCPDCGGGLRPVTNTADTAGAPQKPGPPTMPGGPPPPEGPGREMEPKKRATVGRGQARTRPTP